MENDIRAKLEELKLTTEQIDDLIPLLVEPVPTEQEVPVSIQGLKDQMALEKDYTKRAALAAKIISLSLDSEY